MKNKFDRKAPYNALPALPPSVELETAEVMRALVRASRNLAELKARALSIPNPAILVNTIALQEAQVSSEIENIFTTTDELYRGLTFDGKNLSLDQKEVLYYQEALWHGFQVLQERPVIGLNLITELVSKIKGHQQEVRVGSGTQIAREDRLGNVETIYTPPVGRELILKKLENLEQFINGNGSSLDPLIKMAVAHYQFEAIHPFSDGNGRTGRILNILYLMQSGLLNLPVLYLSRYIISRKAEYYKLLLSVTEKSEWEAWVLFIINGVTETAESDCRKVESIAALLEASIDLAKANLPSRMYSKELIELLFVKPYSKVKDLVDAGIAKRQTASVYLKKLEELGIVECKTIGRENIFINFRLLEILKK